MSTEFVGPEPVVIPKGEYKLGDITPFGVIVEKKWAINA